MHIPTADTDTLELLPFREALEKSGQRGDYDAARWLYVPDFYTEYRYILGTRGEKPLICIGVNLSTAALNEHLHAENMAAFRYVLEASLPRRPAVWAAWGNIIEMRPYLPRCVSDMIAAGEELGAKWFTAGKRSVKGHPHHPLYLRRDTPLDPFDVKSYIDTLERRTHHAEL